MRYFVVFILAATLAGCVSDTTMLNPQTGKTYVCEDQLKGLNPWSQSQACVAQHEAQGWVVADPMAQ